MNELLVSPSIPIPPTSQPSTQSTNQSSNPSLITSIQILPNSQSQPSTQSTNQSSNPSLITSIEILPNSPSLPSPSIHSSTHTPTFSKIQSRIRPASSTVPSTQPTQPNLLTQEPTINAPERIFPSRRNRNPAIEMLQLMKDDLKQRRDMEKRHWEEKKKLNEPKLELELRKLEQDKQLKEADIEQRREQHNELMSVMATASKELATMRARFPDHQ